MPILKNEEKFSLTKEAISEMLNTFGLKEFKKGSLKIVNSPNKVKEDRVNPGKVIQPGTTPIKYEIQVEEDGLPVTYRYYTNVQQKKEGNELVKVYFPLDRWFTKSCFIENLEELFVIMKSNQYCSDSTKAEHKHLYMIE